jgi:hypothetical protein
MIDADLLRNWRFEPVHQRYDARDTILYALGVGLGHDPLDGRQLRFVYEADLQALPTMAVVLGSPGFWVKDPATGVDWMRVLHGEQHLVLHRPVPAAATVVGNTRVTLLVDKGEGRGALMHTERTIDDAVSGAPIATARSVSFLRADGGFASRGQRSDDPPAARPPTPESPPRYVCDLGTRPEAALVYRLCGDLNPVHADPAVAAGAGFCRPILRDLVVLSHGTARIAG